MASYNKVFLLGNLTRDVELKYLSSGTAVADFGLAVNERIGSGDNAKEKTMFIDCTCFGRTAEVANEYLAKGSQVFIDGRIDFSTWESDGQKRSKHGVVVDKLQMLGAKREGGAPRQESRQKQEEPFAASAAEEIPF